MAKKKSRTMKKSEATVPAKRGRRIAIGLIVSMLIAGVAFAQWGLFASQKQHINSRPATPSVSPTTSSLDPPKSFKRACLRRWTDRSNRGKSGYAHDRHAQSDLRSPG